MVVILSTDTMVGYFLGPGAPSTSEIFRPKCATTPIPHGGTPRRARATYHR